ncbi:MAG: ArsR family transcriptional regulator [Actinobacteria bacterium]|nr:MAG: ArsR family transcriptional regulator [Actinomycetota bacterium]
MQNDETKPPQGSPGPAKGAVTEDMLVVLKQQARFCKTMGHPMRLFILHLLHERGEEIGQSELVEVTGLTRASLSQHIAQMSAAGLVITRRDGRFVLVRLARAEIGQACELVHRALRKHAEEGAERFSEQEQPGVTNATGDDDES